MQTGLLDGEGFGGNPVGWEFVFWGDGIAGLGEEKGETGFWERSVACVGE